MKKCWCCWAVPKNPSYPLADGHPVLVKVIEGKDKVELMGSGHLLFKDQLIFEDKVTWVYPPAELIKIAKDRKCTSG